MQTKDQGLIKPISASIVNEPIRLIQTHLISDLGDVELEYVDQHIEQPVAAKLEYCESQICLCEIFRQRRWQQSAA